MEAQEQKDYMIAQTVMNKIALSKGLELEMEKNTTYAHTDAQMGFRDPNGKSYIYSLEIKEKKDSIYGDRYSDFILTANKYGYVMGEAQKKGTIPSVLWICEADGEWYLFNLNSINPSKCEWRICKMRPSQQEKDINSNLIETPCIIIPKEYATMRGTYNITN